MNKIAILPIQRDDDHGTKLKPIRSPTHVETLLSSNTKTELHGDASKEQKFSLIVPLAETSVAQEIVFLNTPEPHDKPTPLSDALPKWMELWKGMRVPTNLPTVQRDEVIRLYERDPETAQQLLEEMDNPWFKCQALSHILIYGPIESATDVFNRCIAIAMGSTDDYLAVGVTAWPLRAIIHLQKPALAAATLSLVIERSHKITHPVCRLDALYRIWGDVFSLPRQHSNRVLEEFRISCRQANSWRAGYKMMHAVNLAAQHDKTLASELVNEMKENWFKRRAQRFLNQEPPATK
ncbi:MAG: hypothetical protein ACI97A_002091 [Planctomycetota bacterium]|jgi:hypothetical protein